MTSNPYTARIPSHLDIVKIKLYSVYMTGAARGKEKHNYHHGDLKRALLDAARVLAAQRGIDGFTLREVARQAGVSHAAPYHHFRDKAALVEALGMESYAALAEALRRARDHAKSLGAERLCDLGVAYVRFAVESPAEFRLMNRPELRCPADR